MANPTKSLVPFLCCLLIGLLYNDMITIYLCDKIFIRLEGKSAVSDKFAGEVYAMPRSHCVDFHSRSIRHDYTTVRIFVYLTV